MDMTHYLEQLGSIIGPMLSPLIPRAVSGGWRGLADVVALAFYLPGIALLPGMALLEIGGDNKGSGKLSNMKLLAASGRHHPGGCPPRQDLRQVGSFASIIQQY